MNYLYLFFLSSSFALFFVFPGFTKASSNNFSIYCLSNGDGTANCTRDDNQKPLSCVGMPGATVECYGIKNSKYECIPLMATKTVQLQYQLSCDVSPTDSSSNELLILSNIISNPNVKSNPTTKKQAALKIDYFDDITESANQSSSTYHDLF